LALKSIPAPRWAYDAACAAIDSHSAMFVDTPTIPVERGELSPSKIRATLPVFIAGVPRRRDDRRSAIAHNKLWFKPKRVAWRFLLETARGVTVSVEVHANRRKHAFHQLQQGPFAQQIFDSVQVVARSSRLKGRDFSLGVLQIPSLYFSALRLTAKRGQELFVPLVAFPGRLKIGSFCSRKKVVSALVDKWIERKEAHKKLNILKAKLPKPGKAHPGRSRK
jgi:hypothetical protein